MDSIGTQTRAGRASARFAMEAAGVPTVMDDGRLLYVAADERGRELEIIAIPLDVGTCSSSMSCPPFSGGGIDDQS